MQASVISLTVVLLVTLMASDTFASQDESSEPSKIEAKEFFTLLDFQLYKQKFHKHYGSTLEELRRRARFIPRALHVIVCHMKYRLGAQSYDCGFNHLTDYLPEQLKRMQNHGDELDRYANQNNVTKTTNVTHVSELENKGQHNRQKRAIKWFRSKRLGNQILPVRQEKIGQGTPVDSYEWFVRRTKNQLLPKIQSVINERQPLSSPYSNDVLYADHSQLGCMGEVRSQGDCGSCHAFVAIPMYEWLYCKKYFRLRRFSEQYIVDCGAKYIDNLHGCSGGSFLSSLKFVRNFGLEAWVDYPYVGMDQSCRIKTGNIAKTGWVRADADRMYVLPYDLWPDYLQFGPLAVAVHVLGTDFFDYSGGVHDLTGCDPSSEKHLMLMVGYGYQNGRQYWKIRNSYGPDWGESGYYRVSEESHYCFILDGYAFATRDGEEHMLDTIYHNDRHSSLD